MGILELKNLKKYFHNPRGMLHAVDDVTLGVEKNKTLGVVGESGCGKTSLGRVVLRMIEPTSGEIWYDGQEITAMNMKQVRQMRTKMQMIYQDPYSSIDPRMSITQTLEEPFKIFKLTKSKEELQRRVGELMDIVGIAKRFANVYPHELDGGRRQRVGIARALALDPKFIVCDEPVSALDVSIQAQVLNLLLELQKSKGLTYMFITHDLSVVRYISDDICVMYLGRVVEKCPSDELFSNPLHPYTQALLSAILIPNIHNKTERIILKGELSSPINPLPQCRFAPRCPYAADECLASEPKLLKVGEGHVCACHRVADLAENR